MYQWVADRGGSVSAEHGLGQMKNHMLGCELYQSMWAELAQG